MYTSSEARQARNALHRHLNPIVEEEDSERLQQRSGIAEQIPLSEAAPNVKIKTWCPPTTDYVPTPRAAHFTAGSAAPSSTSTASAISTCETTPSSPWNRTSYVTVHTEFDDLYDVSDDGEDLPEDGPPSVYLPKFSDWRSAQAASHQFKRLIISTDLSESDQTRLTGEQKLKTFSVPVLLSPSAQLPMSPEQVDFMGKQQAQELPTVSAPPSLDGSLSSEQLTALSAPVTPIIGNDEMTVNEVWEGVRLQPVALETLDALSGDHDEDKSLQFSQNEMLEQRRKSFANTGPTNAEGQDALGRCRRSLADLTRLDIPSPGGFFSDLSPRSRFTWHPQPNTPAGSHQPTSTIAEQFYRGCLGDTGVNIKPPESHGRTRGVSLGNYGPASIIEHFVDLQEEDVSDDVPTARPILQHNDTDSSEETARQVCMPASEDPVAGLNRKVEEFAPEQQRKIEPIHDRTEDWLLTQQVLAGNITCPSSYLNDCDNFTQLHLEDESPDIFNATSHEVGLGQVSNEAASHGSRPQQPRFFRRESAYYRSFRQRIARSQPQSVFVHQQTRFEALQSQRVAFHERHRNQLLGRFQLKVVPISARQRLSANVARGDLDVTDDLQVLRREKLTQATDQIATAVWHVAAWKFLMGDRLIAAPFEERLVRSSFSSLDTSNGSEGRAKILDLGGLASCDWAWHCALQYPKVSVYSVTARTNEQLSNSKIRGPPNHRNVAVERLTRLPFANDHFDYISARELHSSLRVSGRQGHDEWDLCVRECMRVLKPGGYLEFSIMDSALINSGPLGLAKSTEFGYSLRTLGYDPQPSRLWLERLRRAGFDDIHQAMLHLPVGARRRSHNSSLSDWIGENAISGAVSSHDLSKPEGSIDNVANICGIAGMIGWERWLLRCEIERMAGGLRLLDCVPCRTVLQEAGRCLNVVHAIIEEGRDRNAGLGVLTGYARKPEVRGSDVIKIGLARST